MNEIVKAPISNNNRNEFKYYTLTLQQQKMPVSNFQFKHLNDNMAG